VVVERFEAVCVVFVFEISVTAEAKVLDVDDCHFSIVAVCPDNVNTVEFVPVHTDALPAIIPPLITSPETAIVLVVALVVVKVIFPAEGELLSAAMRAYIVVDATLPEDRVSVKVLLNPEVAAVEISNPVGAAMLIFAERFVPETVKFWVVDSKLGQPLNADSELTEVVIVGIVTVTVAVILQPKEFV
jgi:hypothetical protein